MIIFRSVLLRMRNVSDKSCTENQNTHFMFRNLFPKSCRLWDNVEKILEERGRSQMTIQYGACSLHAGYRHTLRICNTYCFSTTTMVTRTPLDVTLYVHWLSCCHCDSVASVRWELVLNIMQMMFNLQMIKYIWSFWCWASRCASWYRLTVSTSWLMLIWIRNIISWQHVSAILQSSWSQRSVKIKLRPHNIKLYKRVCNWTEVLSLRILLTHVALICCSSEGWNCLLITLDKHVTLL
jgi:hypothetical protein